MKVLLHARNISRHNYCTLGSVNSIQQCHAQLAIGGKPTAKKGKKCKVCGNINHLNCRTCKHFTLPVALEKKEANIALVVILLNCACIVLA